MKKQYLPFFLLILFMFSASLSYGQHDAEAVLKHLDKYLDKHRIPGAMISIVRSDTVLFAGGIGFANIAQKEAVSAQHLFRQGSISKSFTALALYQLLQQSSYDLHTPIKEIDPNIPFHNPWEKDFPVRVAHLLEHTSGFEDFHLHAIYNTKDEQMPPVMDMVNDHRNSLQSRWQPGTKKAYSNPNYIVAGHLIEVLSGQPFADYIREHLLKKIGMNSSDFYFKQPSHQAIAQAYQRVGTELHPHDFVTINGGPAGDFCSNASDMGKYLQFMLKSNSSLFSKQDIQRIESPQTSIAAKNGLRYGYGLGNYTIWKNGHLFHGHGGEIDGYAARYIYSRSADLGIAVAINRNGNVNAIVDEILTQLFTQQKAKAISRTTYPIPTAIQQEFSGFYEFKSPKSELIAFSDRMLAGLSLDFQDDKLITRTILGKAKDTLYYAGNHQFYLNQETVPSILLISNPSAKPVLWINDHYTEQESRAKRLCIFFGLLFSLLLLMSFLIYGTIWLIRSVFKPKKRLTSQAMILLGACLSFILLFIGFGFTLSDMQQANTVQFSSVLMYISAYAMVLLSLLSIWKGVKLNAKPGFKVYYLLTSIATVCLSIYLWDIGFVGLKLWSY